MLNREPMPRTVGVALLKVTKLRRGSHSSRLCSSFFKTFIFSCRWTRSFYFIYCYVVLKIELTVSHVLGKCFTTERQPQSDS